MERFFEKKKRGKKSREGSWNLTDRDGKQAWEGVPEDQSSTYVLLRMEGKDFKVFPVGKWYNFKERKHYQTLTLEQAEEQVFK
jgi:transcription initiation factor TFIIF subunit alpha